MISLGKAVHPMLWAGALVLGAAGLYPAVATPHAGKVILAPHRAVYDLKLARSNGTRGVESVRGRILYDFSGNACEGYKLQFRQVSELESGAGKSTLSDLRSNTWENAGATQFRFSSQSFMDEQEAAVVDGQAERRPENVAISLVKPEKKKLTVTPRAVFPTEHMRRIIEAARAGKSVLNFPVFDGSENGEKIYNTLTVIGQPIAPGQKPPTDAAAKQPALATLTRWPVTISYFEQETPKKQQSGEQTPTYAISFELYENGISRALTLSYSDFSISGEMSSLEVKNSKPCH